MEWIHKIVQIDKHLVFEGGKMDRKDLAFFAWVYQFPTEVVHLIWLESLTIFVLEKSFISNVD